MELSQWRQFSRHPLSEIFPDMEDVSFEAMTADMKEHGYDNKQQVLLYENKVLDGWHRLRAAAISGKTPTFDTYKGSDPLGEVIRRNLTRRHMDTSQRAMVAAKIVNIKAPGRPSGKTNIVSNDTISQGQAADLMNVSRKRVNEAAKVEANGTPTLQQAVNNGTISVSDAAKIASEPSKVQNQAVKDVQAGTAASATAAVNGQKKPAASSEPAKDKDGNPYPQQSLAAVQFVSRLNELVRHLRDGCDLVTQIASEPIGLYLDPNGIVSRLTEAKKLVLASFPAHVCKNCKGKSKKCEWCKGAGWQTKGGFQQCPEPNA